jgi:hypothetical protein
VSLAWRSVPRGSLLAREATLSAAAAASFAAVLAWAGPPGTDLAAHSYQRTLFIHHGFTLWNNFWYAGRYSFVTYSALYYPLAAELGIRIVAVAAVAVAALAFAVVAWREWGRAARWSSRTFGVVWAGIVLSAAFPFALGAALALLAVWALQARAHWRFGLLAALTLAASPLAFLLLGLVLAGVAAGKRARLRQAATPAALVLVLAAAEVLLWRLFPSGGRYPFSLEELAAACVFCAFGVGLTWRIERAAALRFVFVLYAAACVASFVVPSAIGENIVRLRYAAIPVTVLALALREWRPRVVALVALGLATSWNVTPLVASFEHGVDDPGRQAAYWLPATRFLRAHLTPAYRAEAVDTPGHWAAYYLPRAGIPLARGWYRQDDFPQNAVLYGSLGPRAYVAWLRALAVRYVVLTDAQPDYSARAEAHLLRGSQAPLEVAFRTRTLTIFRVPDPRPLVDGGAQVLHLGESSVLMRVPRAGEYRVAVRYSPYLRPSSGCAARARDGMTRLSLPAGGVVKLSFTVGAREVLEELTGSPSEDCP